MVNGLYTATRGMNNLQSKMDILAHNLANTHSNGFKESMLVTRSEIHVSRNDENLLHQREFQFIEQEKVDFSQGPLVSTDNHFDLALQGPGFFEVETPQGSRYTRNGAFTLNDKGELVTLNGHNVLDSSGGHITIEGSTITVSRGGMIFSDGAQVARLNLVDFDDKLGLSKEGQGYFKNDRPVDNLPKDVNDTEVQQGMLEGSNVNTVDSMILMIRINRNYDIDQKAVHAIDETLDKAVNTIPRV